MRHVTALAMALLLAASSGVARADTAMLGRFIPVAVGETARSIWVNPAAIPTGGETVMPTIPDDPFVQAALNKLGVDFRDPLAFRYTITTGPGTGIDATLVITAEADFEPGGPVHTVTQELYLHKQNQEVIITPPTTTNEFD